MDLETSPNSQKNKERAAILFLTIFLAPVISVSLIAGFGFSIWISQMMFG